MTKEEFIDRRTKIISKMLDNPDENGIYPTTIAFEKVGAPARREPICEIWSISALVANGLKVFLANFGISIFLTYKLELAFELSQRSL